MLWTKEHQYIPAPFEKEEELELVVREVQNVLFGPERVYLDVKKKIGKPSGVRNIPDGYLIDLSSKSEPRLYTVENELAKHDPLKHVAVQILEFSLSFATSYYQVKNILKDAINKVTTAKEHCEAYALQNGFDNIDFLLERMIHDNGFNALVIIDESVPTLETALLERFKFPVEILTIERYQNSNGGLLYRFDPFLYDVTHPTLATKTVLDLSEIDCIVVPAQEQGFKEVFLGENQWRAIRIHSSMINKIKYIASYQVKPVSAITHVAKVAKIEHWEDSAKYAVYFDGPAKKIKPPIKLPHDVPSLAPQSARYTSKARLDKAKSLKEVF